MRSTILFLAVLIVGLACGPLQLAEAHGRTLGPRKSLSHALSLQARFRSRTSTTGPQYSYETKYFTQFLDHFNFHDSTKTFQQRYLINTDNWQVPNAANGYTAGPMFFYTGNEGGIDLFASNTGFVWEIAPRFNAMVVFAEHRYYGETMPFGNQTYKSTDNLQFLTSEQALADFAVLINALKAEYLPPQSNGTMPVIAFGGSYGGMLTAWFRIKYPHIVIGGIAASAPIWQLEGLVSDEIFSEICTRDFALYGDACPKGIRKSWDILEDWSTDPVGLTKINSIFKPCQPLTSKANITGPLFAFIESALTYMPMVNYPYPASFLGPMPAWPCQAACAFFSAGQSDEDTVVALKDAINVFYNFTGEAGACFNLGDAGPDTLGDLGGWNYQSCTEMVMPIGQNGVDDVFYPAPWNLSAIIAGCQSTYGITPRPDWVATEYGGWDLARSGASNIVFSNGDMDPWSGGGVLTNQSDTLVAVMIKNGAHHLDLRESNPADPDSVIAARQFHIASITKWIQEYRTQTSTVFPQPCGGCPTCECGKAKFSTVKIVLISCFTTAGAVAAVGLCFYFFINDAKKKEMMRNQASAADQRAESTPIAVEPTRFGRTQPYSTLEDDM